MECPIPAPESVPESVPQSAPRRMTKSFYYAPGFVNGTRHVPPVDSVNGPKSHRIPNGTGPALGMKTRRVTPNKGTGSYKSRKTNSGTKVLAPAPVNGNSPVGEFALNRSSSTGTIVVQSNKKTVVENGCSSSAPPKSRRGRRGFGSKRRLAAELYVAFHPPFLVPHANN